jgi:anti-sigma regulatory factor (Ser/Thr protein kinase)
MEMTPSQMMVALGDRSGVGEARQRAAQLARALDFDSNAAGQLALAATEAASNVLKHAGSGKLLLRALGVNGKAAGIEVITLDQGPGMASVAESMRDGHSTAGSPGTGLGALGRMTSGLDIWSQPGKGTLLRFEVWPAGAAGPRERFASGAISVPKRGESVCGDDWAVIQAHGRLLLFVVDGLGHGPAAADAARAGIAAVRKHAARKPAEIIEAVHDALRPTRGAAAALALVQPERELCVYCGVGNISASVLFNGKPRNMVSHNGTLGHQVRKIQEFQYPFPRQALLLAHSDGIGTHWDLAAYPGLERRHPTLVAAALYRDHDRGRDDVTVVAVRPAEAAP